MHAWQFGLIANATIGVAYILISATVLRGVYRTGQWSNRLAVATGAIFATCAGGHLAHFEHLLTDAEGAARLAYDPHLALVDLVTATVGVTYWQLRARFGALLGAGMVFDDTRRRLDDAAMINDLVLQQLATAKLALDRGETEIASRAVDEGLSATSQYLTSLDPEAVSVG